MSKIDVIIPIKGRPTMLHQRSLPALVCQTFQDFRVAIVDDGSSEYELTEIKQTIKEFTVQGLDIILLKNRGRNGAAGARNHGFNKTESEYVLWFDSDDVLLENKLESSLKLIESADFDVAITRAQHLVNGKQTNSYWGEPKAPNKGLYEYHFPFQTMCALYRRSFLIENHIFWNENQLVYDDLEFSNKVILASDNWVYSPMTTAHYYVPTKNSRSIGSSLSMKKLNHQKAAVSEVVSLIKKRSLRLNAINRLRVGRKRLSLMKERLVVLLNRRKSNIW